MIVGTIIFLFLLGENSIKSALKLPTSIYFILCFFVSFFPLMYFFNYYIVASITIFYLVVLFLGNFSNKLLKIVFKYLFPFFIVYALLVIIIPPLAMFIPLMIILFGFVLFSKILKDILCNYIPQKAILFSKNIRKKILS